MASQTDSACSKASSESHPFQELPRRHRWMLMPVSSGSWLVRGRCSHRHRVLTAFAARDRITGRIESVGRWPSAHSDALASSRRIAEASRPRASSARG